VQFRIKKGLDLPVAGEPEQVIADGAETASVALLGDDYPGLRPSLLVAEGDRVRLGQALFTNRRCPDVQFTSPGSGVVRAIHRGDRRSLVSLVIELSGDDEAQFARHSRDALPGLTRPQVIQSLLDSGLWTALRTRPYSKTPHPGSTPHAIFVTAMDSNPLAARADVVIDAACEHYEDGLRVLSHLTDGPIYVCRETGADIPDGDPARITTAEFSGPHPAGLVGTHIQLLAPAGAGKTVWHVGYQDVIAMGRLFTTGRLCIERIVALAGAALTRPRLVRTRLGASTRDLLHGELQAGEHRVVSGSLLSGRHASGFRSYLGRFHSQLCVVAEEPSRASLGWFVGGRDGYSIHGFPVASRSGRRKRAFSTALHGARRALMPLDTFERVMPLDILPTQLLRSLVVHDTEMAQALGCLELDEEDLALCSFVCPSKHEYGPLLRAALDQIEKEA
jgi:Na+-transporting NADH:ubiquinone oxidoreductase subunit A